MLLEQAEESKGLAEDDAAASRAAVAEAHAAAQRLLTAQVGSRCLDHAGIRIAMFVAGSHFSRVSLAVRLICFSYRPSFLTTAGSSGCGRWPDAGR